jgi:hypothetical protein
MGIILLLIDCIYSLNIDVDGKIRFRYTALMKTPDWYLKWLATLVTVVGAICTSVNMYPAGPVLLNLGAAIWLIVAIMWREMSLIVINVTLLLIYTVGLIVKLL